MKANLFKVALLASATVFGVSSLNAQEQGKAPVVQLSSQTSTQFSNTPTINADFPTTEWADYADISWYIFDESHFDISTAEQLAGLAQLVKMGNNFSGIDINLTQDIDLAEHLWVPIGFDNSVPFSGNFDGKGHTIRNVLINREGDGDFLGLFGQYVSGHLKNLTIDTAKIVGRDTFGVMAGNLGINSTMENCHVKNAEVIAVYDPKATTSAYNVGALCGSVVTGSTVTDCSAEGSVSGFQQVGGLVGSPWDRAVIKRSHFKGSVKGVYAVGGLIGFSTFGFGPNTQVIIEDCYAIANVEADEKAGGFYGQLQVGIVKNSYCSGTVTGTTDVGGFIGKIDAGLVENGHFDKTLAPIAGTSVATSNASITGHYSADMKVDSFVNLLNANRSPEVWKIEAGVNDNYPITISAALVTAETAPLYEVKIYPSLAQKEVFISSKNKAWHYQIVNMVGSVVKAGIASDKVDVSSLKSGVYILKIKNDSQQSSHKFIKQ